MNRIKEVLKDKGISQTWLADKMGKSYNTINEYARNKRQPSIEVLFRIAEILNMEAKELIEKRDLKEINEFRYAKFTTHYQFYLDSSG